VFTLIPLINIVFVAESIVQAVKILFNIVCIIEFNTIVPDASGKITLLFPV